MFSRKEVVDREFADDVKSQMRDSELLAKYNLSHGDLEEVFKSLLDSETLTPSDFEAWTIFCNQTVPLDIRLFRRRMSHEGLDVFEKDRPQNRGTILNASELGLGIKGLRSEANSVVTLEIPAHPFPGIGPLVLESRCQWIRRAQEDGDYIGGFYVMAVMKGKWEEFQTAIQP